MAMFKTIKEASDQLIEVAYEVKDNPGKHISAKDWLQQAFYTYSKAKDTIRIEGVVIVDRKPTVLSCSISKDNDPVIQVVRQNKKKR